MYLDVTYFGYGVGLVMAAWVMGMIVGTVFRALRSMWFFSLFFLLFVPSPQAAQFDCYTLSTAFITHKNTNTDFLKIDGVQSTIIGDIVESFSCKGVLKINCPVDDYSVSIIPIQYNSPIQVHEYPLLVSLFIGSLAAIAFVLAVDTLSGGRGSV